VTPVLWNVFWALFGMFFSWGMTRWTLTTEVCPRCGQEAALDHLQYRCGCGELTQIEEI